MSDALTSFSERVLQRYATPDNAPVNTVDRCISVPGDAFFIRALSELISLLGEPEFWDDSEGGLSSEDTAAIWRNAFSPMLEDLCNSGSGGDVENLPITIWADEMDYSLASTPSLVVATAQAYCMYMRTDTASNSEEISKLFTCSAGTYKLTVLDARRNDAGIVDVHIDGNLIGQYDPRALTSYNYVASFSGIVLVDGEHVLQLRSTTTSGVEYGQNHTKIWIEKTA